MSRDTEPPDTVVDPPDDLINDDVYNATIKRLRSLDGEVIVESSSQTD